MEFRRGRGDDPAEPGTKVCATTDDVLIDNVLREGDVAVNSAIGNIVGNLPKQDQGWALQMATTLIQPSAALTSLTTQQGGLAISLRVSLYPGDPQPINVSMLISLSVIDSSTVQVSARPLKGSPALVSGPLAAFQIPMGQLNSINMTPTCGNAALAVHLQFPVALGQGQSTAQVPK